MKTGSIPEESLPEPEEIRGAQMWDTGKKTKQPHSMGNSAKLKLCRFLNKYFAIIGSQHHHLNEHEFEQTPGDTEGQESLVYKQSDTPQRLNNNEVIGSILYWGFLIIMRQ